MNLEELAKNLDLVSILSPILRLDPSLPLKILL